MNTCKDCIYYVVCGQYDMYGDCAEKCFDFFSKAPFGKTGSCKDFCSEDTKEIVDADSYCSFAERAKL